jgi:hypothetical protein
MGITDTWKWITMSTEDYLKDKFGESIKDPDLQAKFGAVVGNEDFQSFISSNADSFSGFMKGAVEGGELTANGKVVIGNFLDAVERNPKFAAYLAQNGGTAMGVVTPDVLQNGAKANAVSGILKSIAGNPDYDFAKLDAVAKETAELGEATKRLDELKKAKNPDQEAITAQERKLQEETKGLYRAVSKAGGNIPALAGLQGPEGMKIFMNFFKNLFSGRGIDFAMGRLFDDLGEARGFALNEGEVADINQFMKPVANVMQWMGQPYVDYFRKHGPGISNGFQSYANAASRAATGQDAFPEHASAKLNEMPTTNKQSALGGAVSKYAKSGNGGRTAVAFNDVNERAPEVSPTRREPGISVGVPANTLGG